MIVTRDNLNKLLAQGMSLRGAWNSAQLKALMPYEQFHTGFPRAGWRERLIGKELSQEQVNEFLRLTNRHLAHKTRMIPFEQPFELAARSHMNSIKQELKHSIA